MLGRPVSAMPLALGERGWQIAINTLSSLKFAVYIARQRRTRTLLPLISRKEREHFGQTRTHESSASKVLTTQAGLPATTLGGGTSPVTTLSAAITA